MLGVLSRTYPEPNPCTNFAPYTCTNASANKLANTCSNSNSYSNANTNVRRRPVQTGVYRG